MEKSQNTDTFPIPLWVGWAINIIGWILFVSTFNHVLEIVTAILCIGCVYLAYKHKQSNTPAVMNIERLSPSNLIYASAFEAVWMLSWGLGIW